MSSLVFGGKTVVKIGVADWVVVLALSVENVAVIMFVVAISEVSHFLRHKSGGRNCTDLLFALQYDQVLWEDSTTNRLTEAILVRSFLAPFSDLQTHPRAL